MKFEKPATTNPIDQLKVVGKPIHRIDGQLKTTARRPMPMSGMSQVLLMPMDIRLVQRSPKDM